MNIPSEDREASFNSVGRLYKWGNYFRLFSRPWSDAVLNELGIKTLDRGALKSLSEDFQARIGDLPSQVPNQDTVTSVFAELANRLGDQGLSELVSLTQPPHRQEVTAFVWHGLGYKLRHLEASREGRVSEALGVSEPDAKMILKLIEDFQTASEKADERIRSSARATLSSELDDEDHPDAAILNLAHRLILWQAFMRFVGQLKEQLPEDVHEALVAWGRKQRGLGEEDGLVSLPFSGTEGRSYS